MAYHQDLLSGRGEDSRGWLVSGGLLMNRLLRTLLHGLVISVGSDQVKQVAAI